ncbi:MAG: hypothetical protein VW757_06630 [Halieaceae bacterium]
MATRATYRFIDRSDWRPITTVYNHWDGYPEGAASHLCTVRNAEDFIRRNEQSEITPGHEAHGDTEWRYDIYYGAGQEPTVEWFERKMPYTNFEHFESVDEIPLSDFCERFGYKEEAA